MRVVWVTHNYPRHAGDQAGAFLHRLAVELRSREVDLRVVAPSDAGQGGRGELDGVPVHRVRYGTQRDERLAYHGAMQQSIASPRQFLAFNRLRAALRAGAEEECEGAAGNSVVHAHWWVPSGLAAPVNVPMVLTCHGTDIRLLQRYPMVGWFARPTFRRAKVVTAVSHALATTIERTVGVTVAEDAVQPMPVAEVPRPWSDGSGDIVVLGRLTDQKRVHLAIDALAVARRRGMSRGLTIVGDGPNRSKLELQAAALQLGDAVRFVGAVDPAAVPAFFQSACCCLMPAKSEGFGLAAAEALMQGVPVIACRDGGGLLDVVPTQGAGRLVSPTAEALADGLLELLSDGQAGDVARAEGMRWRERLSPGFVAERCMVWYRRALNA